MMNKYRICDGCPCMNNDYEWGEDCNLDANIRSVNIENVGWKTVALKCPLTEIAADGLDFKLLTIYLESKTVYAEKSELDYDFQRSIIHMNMRYLDKLSRPSLLMEILKENDGTNKND